MDSDSTPVIQIERKYVSTNRMRRSAGVRAFFSGRTPPTKLEARLSRNSGSDGNSALKPLTLKLNVSTEDQAHTMQRATKSNKSINEQINK